MHTKHSVGHRPGSWACIYLVTVLLGCDGAEGGQCTVVDNDDASVTITCADGSTATIPGPAVAASCRVEATPTGCTMISCPDGGSATVCPGSDGQSCHVTATASGCAELACESGEAATICSGEDGAVGMPGSGCSVVTSGGCATITCGDGTSATVCDGIDAPEPPSPCSAVQCGTGFCVTTFDGKAACVCVGDERFDTALGTCVAPTIAPSPCDDGPNCGALGYCVVAEGAAICACAAGLTWSDDEERCVPTTGGGENPCVDFTCGDHGFCVLAGGTAPRCICDSGFAAADGGPCAMAELCLPGSRTCSAEGDVFSCSELRQWRVATLCTTGCTDGWCNETVAPNTFTLDHRGGLAEVGVEVDGLPARVKLDIAPGAIAAATTFTVTVDDSAWVPLSEDEEPEEEEPLDWRPFDGNARLAQLVIEPSGTVFDADTILTFVYDEAHVERDGVVIFPDGLHMSYLDPALGPLPVASTINPAHRTISGAITHLSTYVVGGPQYTLVGHANGATMKDHAVLLVHGWKRKQDPLVPDPSEGFGDFGYLPQLLVGVGQAYGHHVAVYELGYNTKWGISNGAYWLGTAIEHIRTTTNIKQVTVVAHSMGGLVARAYVEGHARQKEVVCVPTLGCADYDYGPLPIPLSRRRESLKRIVTVATPHQGANTASEWWAALLVWWTNWGFADYGFQDLHPGSSIIQDLKSSLADLSGPSPDYVVIRAEGDGVVSLSDGSLHAQIGAWGTHPNILEYAPIPVHEYAGGLGMMAVALLHEGTHNIAAIILDTMHPAFDLICEATGICPAAATSGQDWACEDLRCWGPGCTGRLCGGVCASECGDDATCGGSWQCIAGDAGPNPLDSPPHGSIIAPQHLAVLEAGTFTVTGEVFDDHGAVDIEVVLTRWYGTGTPLLIDSKQLYDVASGSWSLVLDLGADPVLGEYTIALRVNDRVNPSLEADSVVILVGKACLYCESEPRLVTWGAGAIPTRGVVSVTGADYALLLRGDGEVIGFDGQHVPAGGSGVAAIAAVSSAAAMLRSDGTVVAIGSGEPANSMPPGLSDVVAVDVSRRHGLALRADGTVVGWGGYPAADPPADLNDAVAIVATPGGNLLHAYPCSFALRTDGTVVSWGHSSCADPSALEDIVAIAGAGGFVRAVNADGISGSFAGVVDLAAAWYTASPTAYNHTVYLLEGGGVVVSGDNAWGQATVPIGVSDVIEVHAFERISMALIRDGTFRMWGLRQFPQRIHDSAVDYARGLAHGVALVADGTVVAWGGNSYGQLDVPMGLQSVRAVAAGRHHSLALRENGTVVAWGAEGYDDEVTAVPAGLSGVVAMNVYNDSNFVLTNQGTVIRWGPANSPPSSFSEVAAITTRGAPIALKLDGSIVPLAGTALPPAHLTDPTAVAAGSTHFLAIRSNTGVLAWGTSSHGATVVPAGLNGVVGVAAGERHSLALKADGTIVGWGDNSFGQLTVPEDLYDYDIVSIGAASHTSYAYVRGPQPEVTGISHAQAGAGEVVTVTGSGFARVESVRIGGSVARWKVLDPTVIQVTVPSHATTGPVVVDTIWGRSESAQTFTQSSTAAP